MFASRSVLTIRSSPDQQKGQPVNVSSSSSTHRWATAHTARIRKATLGSCVCVSLVTFSLGVVAAGQTSAHDTPSQAPARGATAAPARTGGSGTAPKVEANLLQLMRGIPYPASNVIFAAQDDLNKFTPPADPSVSPNPLTSMYGGWQAVENAALALAETANLIALPGRMCSNGKLAPVRRPDWIKYTQGLREAGMAAYKAAQSKNQDAIVDVAGKVSDACSACHDVYREKRMAPGSMSSVT